MKDEDDKKDEDNMNFIDWQIKKFNELTLGEVCLSFVLFVLIGIIGAIIKICC